MYAIPLSYTCYFVPLSLTSLPLSYTIVVITFFGMLITSNIKLYCTCKAVDSFAFTTINKVSDWLYCFYVVHVFVYATAQSVSRWRQDWCTSSKKYIVLFVCYNS